MLLCVYVFVMIAPPAADGGTFRLSCGGPNGQPGTSALGAWEWSLSKTFLHPVPPPLRPTAMLTQCRASISQA